MLRTKLVLLLILIAAGSGATYYLIRPASTSTTNHGQSGTTSVISSEPELSQYMKEYAIYPNGGPNAITTDSQGNIWFTISRGAAIGELDPSNGTIREFHLPEASNATVLSWGILVDDVKGKVWFTDADSNAVWSFDASSSHAFTKFPLPNPLSSPYQITQDRSGNIWFTEIDANKIGEILANNNSLHEYSIPIGEEDANIPNMGPAGIAIDNRGTIWFTEVYADSIGSFSNGRFEQFGLIGKIDSPNGIAIDTSGNVWFTQHGPSFISKFNPKTYSLVTYSTSVIGVKSTLPYFIQIDHEGNVWFNEHYGNAIAKFVPSNNTMVEYEIPSRNPEVGNISGALTLALSPTGQPWFTEFDTGKIGTVNANTSANLRISVTNMTAVPETYALPTGKNSSLRVSVLASGDERVSLEVVGAFVGNFTFQFSPSSGNGSFSSSLFITEKGRHDSGATSFTLTVSAVTEQVVVSQIIVLET